MTPAVPAHLAMNAPLAEREAKMESAPFTNAHAARAIAKIARTATNAMAEYAEGMGNPNFCAADGSIFALSIAEDLRSQLKFLEKRATAKVQHHD